LIKVSVTVNYSFCDFATYAIFFWKIAYIFDIMTDLRPSVLSPPIFTYIGGSGASSTESYWLLSLLLGIGTTRLNSFDLDFSEDYDRANNSFT